MAFRLCGIPTWLHWTFPGVGLGVGVPVGLLGWWATPDGALALFAWTALAVALVVMVHEAGHVFTARALGIEVHGLCFAAGGGCCLIGDTETHWHELAYSASGLVAQLVLALVLWLWAGPPWPLTASDPTAVLAAVNALLWLVNAWPSRHSDGARIAKAWRAMRDAR
jgi:hypothetical protein